MGEQDMECDCFACPFGMKMGFAYTCNKEITGPCKSFDCFGLCNGKYDPGNLVGRETFAPSVLNYKPTVEDDTSGAAAIIGTSNDLGIGTLVMIVALFRMVVL